jgi:hypothetical protein
MPDFTRCPKCQQGVSTKESDSQGRVKCWTCATWFTPGQAALSQTQPATKETPKAKRPVAAPEGSGLSTLRQPAASLPVDEVDENLEILEDDGDEFDLPDKEHSTLPPGSEVETSQPDTYG